VRIVDPLGRAVAWLAPLHRGRLVGFAVRPSGERGTPWTHLFHAAEPGASPTPRFETGCGVRCELLDESGKDPVELGSSWRFMERDPTAATVTAWLDDNLPVERRELVNGLRLSFSAALRNEELALELLAENRSRGATRLRFGFELALAGVLLRDATGTLHTDLPGSPDHGDISGLRVDIRPRSTVRLGTDASPVAVEVELTSGVSRLRYLPPSGNENATLLAFAANHLDDALLVEPGESHSMSLALRVALH
jgi:hypothetical protein